MQVTAIYPGTFDPFTLGHQQIAMRAARLFDHVIIMVANTTNKEPMFSLEERMDLAKVSCESIENISVQGFEGLLVEQARKQQARAIIRGLRMVSDFEYEFQMANMNRHLAEDIESVFLTTDEQYSFISSTLVKEVAKLDGDIAPFVHPKVCEALQQKYSQQS